MTSASGRCSATRVIPVFIFRLPDAEHRLVCAMFVLSAFMNSAVMNETQTSVALRRGELGK
jgi:hypothetical protein